MAGEIGSLWGDITQLETDLSMAEQAIGDDVAPIERRMMLDEINGIRDSLRQARGAYTESLPATEKQFQDRAPTAPFAAYDAAQVGQEPATAPVQAGPAPRTAGEPLDPLGATPTFMPETFLGDVVAGVGRGWQAIEQGANMAALNTGWFSPEEFAKNYAANEADAQSYGQSPTTEDALREFQEASEKGTGSILKTLLYRPRILGAVIADSLPSILPGMVGGFVGNKVGGPLGAMAGVGTGSGMVEYTHAIREYAREHKIDTTKPENVLRMFSDDEFMEGAKEYARISGMTVGLFDAISAGIAGKFFGFKRGLTRAATLKRAAGATAVEAGGGAGGEATKQIAHDGKITDEGGVWVEGLAEGVLGPIESVGALISRARDNKRTGKTPPPKGDAPPPAEGDTVPPTEPETQAAAPEEGPAAAEAAATAEEVGKAKAAEYRIYRMPDGSTLSTSGVVDAQGLTRNFKQPPTQAQVDKWAADNGGTLIEEAPPEDEGPGDDGGEAFGAMDATGKTFSQEDIQQEVDRQRTQDEDFKPGDVIENEESGFRVLGVEEPVGLSEEDNQAAVEEAMGQPVTAGVSVNIPPLKPTVRDDIAEGGVASDEEKAAVRAKKVDAPPPTPAPDEGDFSLKDEHPRPETSSIPYLYKDRGTSGATLKTPTEKVGSVLEAADYLQKQALDANAGVPLTIKNRTPETDETLSRALASETAAHLDERSRRGAPSADSWYRDDVEEALDIASQIHPELRDDSIAKGSPNFSSADEASSVFRLALAITSQNNPIGNNATYAEEQYNTFKETGRFDPKKKYGDKNVAISGNLQLINDLLDNTGGKVDTVRRLLQTSFTARELNAVAKKYKFTTSNFALDDTVYGSAILGAKIGQGFYSNLRGVFDVLTSDLWFMRTWGRLTGHLVSRKPENIPPQVKRLNDSLKEVRASTSDGVFKPKSVRVIPQRAKPDEVIKRARLLKKEWEAHYRKGVKAGTPPKEKPVWMKAVDRILQNSGKVIDSPPEAGSGPKVLAWQKDVMARALDILKEEFPDMSVADMQATVWYPEKEIYGNLTSRPSAHLNTSYADALETIAKKRGLSVKRKPRRGRVVRAAGDGVKGKRQKGVQQSSQRPARARQLTKGQKAEFLEEGGLSSRATPAAKPLDQIQVTLKVDIADQEGETALIKMAAPEALEMVDTRLNGLQKLMECVSS